MKDRFWGTTVGVLLTIGLFFSGLFSWLTPLPLFYIARRHSLKLGGIGWAFVILLVWGFYEFLFSFLGKDASEVDFLALFGKKALLGAMMVYLCFFGSLSLLLAWRSAKEARVIRLMIWGVGGALGAGLIVFLLFTKGHLLSFGQELSRSFGLIVDRSIALRKSSGLSGEEIAFVEKNRQLIVTSFLGVLPGVIFAFGLFLTWINVAVAKQIFASFGFFGTLEDLSSFRIPFLGVWLVIGALSLFLANSYLWQQDTLSFVLINLFIVLFALYFFQGLAIASFYLTLKGVTPWMRLLFYSLLLIFFESLGLFLVGVGFFDSWFNFRKKNVHPSA